VVLLSDHGVSLGLPGDRLIAMQNYIGDKNKTKKLTRYEYTKKPKSNLKLGLNTSSGEGTDILSFNTSNHIILGFKTYGLPYGMVKNNAYPVSLIDIAPTIIDLLHLPTLHKADGISLKPFMTSNVKQQNQPRAMFFETGIWMPLFNVNDLKKGLANNYIAQKLNTLYGYNAKNDYIIIKASAMHNLLSSKQRGILYDDWYLARYPKSSSISSSIISANNTEQHCDFKKTDDQDHNKVVCYIFSKDPNPYYVLVNTKSGKWTMNLNSAFAKTAPMALLRQKFKAFYGSELD